MKQWLNGEYKAIIFEEGKYPLGYALFKRFSDHIYLRQLFVREDRRRQGIGRQAIDWLITNSWKDVSRIRIDVLVGNTSAIAFWKAVGFAEYCITMERE